MKAESRLNLQFYAGVFLIALATLMFEILLTRIFSVTMWYHFAFVAISIAMFGMTIGALLVYIFAARFNRFTEIGYVLSLGSLLFSSTILLGFWVHLMIPFVPSKSILNAFYMAITYLVISVPFVFSGICISLALTKFPDHVGKVYAADLSGAAIGCGLVIFVLKFADGPTAVIIVAFLANLSAILFCPPGRARKLKRWGIMTSTFLGAFAALHVLLVNYQSPLLKLTWVKGERETKSLYEKWNSFSRIKVSGDPTKPEAPFGWGLSSTYPVDRKVRQLYLNIDATAGTMLTAFNGDVSTISHLKYDVTNVVHYIRTGGKVLVVGTGGGRDILSALVFEQQSVLGVEINNEIIKAVNGRFGDFTGHLDRNPHVRFVNDEARSYVARQRDKFDVIQVSLIDTWAATAAGAFVLAENSLYTVEAWKVLLNGLQPNGVLTFSRWYSRSQPREIYRLASLARTALTDLGVRDPKKNIILVRRIKEDDAWGGVGTMLVSKEPFSTRDIHTIHRVSHQLNFETVLDPNSSHDALLSEILSGKDFSELNETLHLRIDPPTDDNPFFFQMLRLRDMTRPEMWRHWWTDPNMIAVFIIGSLLVLVVILTGLCIIGPLVMTASSMDLSDSSTGILYFALIGFGYMLVEVSQMQRLIIFLGHPTYGLSVVLFALLLSSGLGSYSTARIKNSHLKMSFLVLPPLLLSVLLIFGILTPFVIGAFQGSPTPMRILLATAILFPLGFFMGMAFPLGMRGIPKQSSELTPWLWGINGATSVCASVLGVAIAINSSISASFWTGFTCYALSMLVLMWAFTPHVASLQRR